MQLTKAIEGFLLSMRSGEYAVSTIELYDFTLHRVAKFLEDPPVEKIQLEDLNRFMGDLRSRQPPLSGPYLTKLKSNA